YGIGRDATAAAVYSVGKLARRIYRDGLKKGPRRFGISDRERPRDGIDGVRRDVVGTVVRYIGKLAGRVDADRDGIRSRSEVLDATRTRVGVDRRKRAGESVDDIGRNVVGARIRHVGKLARRIDGDRSRISSRRKVLDTTRPRIGIDPGKRTCVGIYGVPRHVVRTAIRYIGEFSGGVHGDGV